MKTLVTRAARARQITTDPRCSIMIVEACEQSTYRLSSGLNSAVAARKEDDTSIDPAPKNWTV